VGGVRRNCFTFALEKERQNVNLLSVCNNFLLTSLLDLNPWETFARFLTKLSGESVFQPWFQPNVWRWCHAHRLESAASMLMSIFVESQIPSHAVCYHFCRLWMLFRKFFLYGFSSRVVLSLAYIVASITISVILLLSNVENFTKDTKLNIAGQMCWKCRWPNSLDWNVVVPRVFGYCGRRKVHIRALAQRTDYWIMQVICICQSQLHCWVCVM